jgi:hypothetical protein
MPMPLTFLSFIRIEIAKRYETTSLASLNSDNTHDGLH